MDYSKIKYMHVERLGTEEVEDLLIGRVHVFPKIDGTNAVVWYENGEVKAGSRKRELSVESDNAGFCAYITQDTEIKDFFEANPDMILYGEWLVPHTLKTYRDECWNRFYVFDVGIRNEEGRLGYLPYDVYAPMLDCFGIWYLPPLVVLTNPTIEDINNRANTNFYMMKEGCIGEGVVCKNYEFYNKYGRQTWGKLVRNEFKEKHLSVMGSPTKDVVTIEDEIVKKYVTKVMVDKEFDKIRVEFGWSSKLIPQLLNTIYYTLITEESWNFVKEFKNPKIDFKRLQQLTFAKVKDLRWDLF